MSQRPFVCLVNLTELDPPLNGGVSRVACEVSRLLIDQRGAQLRPIFLVRWGYIARFEAWVSRSAVIVPSFTSLDARRAVDALHPNLIVSPLFGLSPFARSTVPLITQIPDTLVFDHPELFAEPDRIGRMRVYDALPKAQKVVTISQFSRDQLIRHTGVRPEQISVIGLGSDFTVPERADPLELPDRYVIYPALRWPHKRHDLLMRIMERVWTRDPELCLVLPGTWTDEETGLLSESQHEPEIASKRIFFPGFLTDAQLRIAYRRAEAMLFVSAYEGFGMPVVEAMAEGCPVLCESIGALPEVAGDAALFVEGDNPDTWAQALLDRLPHERAERIARGYAQAARWTWASCREGWQELFQMSGVPLSKSGTPPALPNGSAALTQLDSIRAQLNMDWHGDREALANAPRLALRPTVSLRAWQLRTQLLRAAQAYAHDIPVSA